MNQEQLNLFYQILNTKNSWGKKRNPAILAGDHRWYSHVSLSPERGSFNGDSHEHRTARSSYL